MKSCTQYGHTFHRFKLIIIILSISMTLAHSFPIIISPEYRQIVFEKNCSPKFQGSVVLFPFAPYIHTNFCKGPAKTLWPCNLTDISLKNIEIASTINQQQLIYILSTSQLWSHWFTQFLNPFSSYIYIKIAFLNESQRFSGFKPIRN